MKARWDSNIKEMSRDTVTRDVELQAAQEEISRLQSDLSQRKDDLHRCIHLIPFLDVHIDHCFSFLKTLTKKGKWRQLSDLHHVLLNKLQ